MQFGAKLQDAKGNKISISVANETLSDLADDIVNLKRSGIFDLESYFAKTTSSAIASTVKQHEASAELCVTLTTQWESFAALDLVLSEAMVMVAYFMDTDTQPSSEQGVGMVRRMI